MNWSDLHTDLDQLLEFLEREGVASFAQISNLFALADDDVAALDRRHDGAVGAAVIAFGESRPLPPLSPEERLSLWLRASYAADFCLGLQAAPRSIVLLPPQGDRQRLLEWLLLDLWRTAGFATIHGVIESLVSDFPPETHSSGRN